MRRRHHGSMTFEAQARGRRRVTPIEYVARPARVRGAPLADDVLARLRAYVAQHGEDDTLRHFKISRNALYRALAGLSILRGTTALVDAGFQAEARTG